MNLNLALEYQKLPINCDFSEDSLLQAVAIVGPSFIYEVFVNPDTLLETRKKLNRLGIDTFFAGEDVLDPSPLKPYFNLHANSTFRIYEWVIGAGDKLAGSPGVY